MIITSLYPDVLVSVGVVFATTVILIERVMVEVWKACAAPSL